MDLRIAAILSMTLPRQDELLHPRVAAMKNRFRAGANGHLILREEGLEWAPRWFARNRGCAPFKLMWGEISSAEIIQAFGSIVARTEAVVTIHTPVGGFDVLVGMLDIDPLTELLREHLPVLRRD